MSTPVKESTTTLISDSALRGCWTLPPHLAKSLAQYYLLYWDTEWFLEQRKSSTLDHRGINWHIVLHKCTLDQILKSRRVSLSFRLERRKLSGIVMVRTADGIFRTRNESKVN